MNLVLYLIEKKRDANIVKEKLSAESDDGEDDDDLEGEPIAKKRPRKSSAAADSGNWSFTEGKQYFYLINNYLESIIINFYLVFNLANQ